MTTKSISMRRFTTRVLAAAMLTAVSVAAVGASDAALSQRSYSTGRYSVEIGGANAGYVSQFTGGGAFADVVSETPGASRAPGKHLAGVKYDDISINFGTGMSKPFYEWIKQSVSRSYPRKDGAIVVANLDDKETSRLTFKNALITAVEFPALDAASKDPAKMFLSFAPENTRRTLTVNGAKMNHDAGMAKHGKWLPSNFRLKIDGLEAACAKTNHIDPIGVRVKTTHTHVGEQRDYLTEPGEFAISNLVFTVPESEAGPFYAWHEDFVIKGNNGDDKEKSGTLEFMTENLQTVIFKLTFQHLGIIRVAHDKFEARSEGSNRVKVEMYMEGLVFDYPNAGTP